MNLKIAPSILSADFAYLAQDCRDVLNAGADWLHIDVMDGDFVPNLSLGIPVLAGLSKAVDAFYDVHLMIRRPLEYIEAFARAGADFITFHLEADSDVEKTIEAIHAAGCKAAVSVKPATPVEEVFPYLDRLDMVLIMSVEPGFGGQKFMPQAMDKIAALRERAGDGLMIQVDGGVDANTAPLCTRAGADVLVAGSAVFGKKNRKEAISAIRSACEHGESSL
ncbi:MAG TPA: ribulose-phosphate 3-epimerase [Candidatus Ruthenibacterium avium]|uniref:Ribulose-phosphate 3-epimerase n=1 Tax=Candidatus Ruthenibacterium avium TaxID=2838751 RepID=A0A9D2S0Q0_9FIRM|nr:ribulose-phosphate 3-epimerase [Candidatus Ruthenibacterium avium]